MNEPTTDKSPIEKLLNIFVDESGLLWPNLENGKNKEKWIDPLVAIDKAAKGDLYLRETAIKEAIAYCRNNGMLVSSPNSILSSALQLIHQWAGSRKNDISELEFIAYRNHVIALGYNVRW